MRILAFMPGGMPGIAEIGIIALVLVLLFGARKLPQLARSLGASLTEFKKGRKEGMDERFLSPSSHTKSVKGGEVPEENAK